jgi:DNA-binding NarL/FixJ family response regulator
MDENVIDLLLVDDSEAARKGLKALLKRVSDVRLVGEASGGQEAITLAEQLQPDIILIRWSGGDNAGRTAPARYHPHGFAHARHQRH